MEEVLDLFDENKKNTGIVISRSQNMDLPKGNYILIAVLIVKNSKNQIMMQYTSPSKGSIFALPGGHVLHNEDSKDTIVRELWEEQGLKINKEELVFLGDRIANSKIIVDAYYLKSDFDKEEMLLQQEEVEEVTWMTLEEIDKAYQKGKVRKSSYDSIKNFRTE